MRTLRCIHLRSYRYLRSISISYIYLHTFTVGHNPVGSQASGIHFQKESLSCSQTSTTHDASITKLQPQRGVNQRNERNVLSFWSPEYYCIGQWSTCSLPLPNLPHFVSNGQ